MALYGNKYILIVDTNKKTLIYKILEEDDKNILNTGLYAKCISEVDGIRISTNEGIFFISKVDKNLFKSCYPFEENNAKKLIKAYFSDLNNNPDCLKQIKDIRQDLGNTIFIILNAATNIFYIEDETDNNKKEVQLLLLKIAQFGKIFVEEEEDFNYDKKKILIMINLLKFVKT